MEVTIREYCAQDFTRVVELETEIVDMMSQIDPHKRFRIGKDFNGNAAIETVLKKIERTEGKMLLAVRDDRIVGYVVGTVDDTPEHNILNLYPAKQGYIDTLYVEDRYRGKGIAVKLMEAIEDHFCSVGCTHSSVACVAANDNAHGFYLKMGYGEQYIDFLKKL